MAATKTTKTVPGLRVPSRRFYGESMNMMLMSLFIQVKTLNTILDQEGFAGRRVLGYKIPEWQRPEVWNDDQCRQFIESIYLGANIGAFMVNSSFAHKNCDNILLDGQQRLRAIERYWADDLAVAGEDGVPHLWGELLDNEQAHFFRISFPYIRTFYEDEALMKDAYNRHNFSGTPHTVEQKAEGAKNLRTAATRVP